MDVLANDNELLKYIEIWKKMEALFNEIASNKRGLHSVLANNKECIITKINPYVKNPSDFKKLIKDKYCGYLILLLDSICEVKNKYYPQVLLIDLMTIDECIYEPSYKSITNNN